MGNFNRDRGGRGGDRRGGGGFDRRDKGRGFSRGGDRPAMHKAVCDACKQNCEVPFKPTGNKPIFCSDCFSKQGGGDRRGGDRDRKPRFEDRGPSQSNQDSKDILKGIKTLNYKLDELIRALNPNAPREEVKKIKAAPKKKSGKKKNTAPKKVIKKKTPKKKVAAKKPTKKKKK